MAFPKDFVWGAAAAAYQIEGAASEDGRGPSIWDVHAHTPGKTFEGHTGDVACDHYHRYPEDVALMKALGVGAYRLSLSWPRILPEGAGAANKKGLAFYDRLVDALLEAGIDPWVTLYHWDLPQALQLRGGFLNRDIVGWFGDYAAIAARRLGDRVKNWITINEPPCIVGHGMQEGLFAPALKLPYKDCLQAAHHLLLAHGKSVQALRAGCKGAVRIAITHTARERMPSTNDPRDIEAARADYFSCIKGDMWNLAWWADPVVFGRYPEDGLKNFAGDLPDIASGDMELIAQPVDFLGYNCYGGWHVRAGADGRPEKDPDEWTIGNPRASVPWLAIKPEAPYWAAKFQTERYGLPLVFTENGMANVDFVHLDGKVHDPQRVDFLKRYLHFIRKAVAEGVPVQGYFHWSILDNFEWNDGYKERFGLIHVDYQTQKRTPKESFEWYRQTIKSGGNAL